ncbi:MAG: TMEM165/GDT1 family protein [Pseudomonadota bacterium]|jgi:putative Ca2+/H+ antiporter (TMEM165/GDT1 family)
MDVLMAALVAALLTQVSDRTPWAAAALADRYDNKGVVIAGVALALAFGNALGAIGGMVVAPMLSPNAQGLLLALALLSGGVAGFWPIKPAKVPSWRLGAFGSSFVAVAMLGFGDRMQFITAALAAQATTPAFAAIGATIGSIAVTVPAILLGEKGMRKLPTTALRLVAAAVLMVAGAVQALSALRLI